MSAHRPCLLMSIQIRSREASQEWRSHRVQAVPFPVRKSDHCKVIEIQNQRTGARNVWRCWHHTVCCSLVSNVRDYFSTSTMLYDEIYVSWCAGFRSLPMTAISQRCFQIQDHASLRFQIVTIVESDTSIEVTGCPLRRRPV
jgi:hypothetical protein